MLGFGIEPFGDVSGVDKLGEGFVEDRGQLRREDGAIEGQGLFHSLAGESLALDEAPLDGIEGCELVMLFLQVAQFRGDVEEFTDEVFEVGRERDDELRIRSGRHSGGHEALVEGRVRFVKTGEEGGVETGESSTIIEVFEGEA